MNYLNLKTPTFYFVQSNEGDEKKINASNEK